MFTNRQYQAAVLAAACLACLADGEPIEATGKVRSVVTDFTAGDRFSASPQLFFLHDSSPGGRAVESGAISVDLTERDEAVLCKEIPVWGQPERWILTVEAPQEAAGLEFRVLYQTGGKNCHGLFGRLANDSNHEAHEKSAGSSEARMVAGGWMRQTFEIGGVTNDVAWRTGDGKRIENIKNADLPSRLIQFSVRRGDAVAGQYDIRLVSLEAVCAPNVGAPPLMPVPPGGDAPPETLEVQFLNFTGQALTGAEVRVVMTCWDGSELGTASGALPEIAPGDRAVARIALPKAPESLNFVSYKCELFSCGEPDGRVGKGVVNWTRPLPDGGQPGLSPDSPWGFGAYLHRTADFTSFQNAYAPVTTEEGFANMEKRAALAQAVGAKWERVEFLQYAFAKGKGRYDFSFYDRLCDIAERHGLSPLGLFSHFWPAGSPAFTTQGYDDQVEAFRALATHYRGRIRHWELWNEPWGTWSGPMEDYFRLVDRMFAVAKEIDSENTVIACSAGGLDPKTINAKFLEAEKAPDARFDALCIHPYRGEPAEDGVLADIAAVAEKSPCGRVWVTEIGWPTCGKWVYRETDQAAYLARFLMTAAGSGKVHSVYGYDLVDDGFNPLERENSFGIVRRDFTPKPACRAVAKVYRTFVSGTPQLERQEGKDGMVVWVFRMGGKSAVWANRDQRVEIRAARLIRFSNLMDETLDEGATAFRGQIGPRNLVFLDGDVIAVETEGTP